MELKKNIHTIAGVGSPVVDQVAQVPFTFIDDIDGDKGGMELVDTEEFASILARLPQPPLSTPGGSAGNTTFALARLGIASRFLGVVGDDSAGIYYRNAFSMLGGSDTAFRTRPQLPTAQCLSLVTPDGERTMRTHLGAALTLAVEDITEQDFRGCDHAHIEGYLLFNPELMRHALKTAKAAGCTVSVDLASFEVVGAAKAELPELLRNYVDMVFANEEEAEAYAGTHDQRQCLDLLSQCCPTAVIKYGARGAVICNGSEICRVPASPVEQVVDTTGAGDMWAAGFLYGMGRGRTLHQCGECASLLGAAVVQHEGAALPESLWETLLERLHMLHDPLQRN